MTGKKALITGGAGFVGPYLGYSLMRRGWQVCIADIQTSTVPEDAEFVRCDVLDREGLSTTLRSEEPRAIFHLASVSHIPRSWEDPRKTWEVNLIGTINLLEACREMHRDTRIILIGSAMEYGKSLESGTPLDESAVLLPDSPFALSKASQSQISSQYVAHHGLDIVRLRPFVVAGPKQEDSYLVSYLCRQAAQVAAGKRKTVTCPPLEMTFDVTDVRDLADAIAVACDKCARGDILNVASGTTITTETLISKLRELAGCHFDVLPGFTCGISDPICSIVGDATQFKRKTGWSAQIPIAKTISDTFAFWRERTT